MREATPYETFDLETALTTLTLEDIKLAKKQLCKAFGVTPKKKLDVIPKQILPYALPTLYFESQLEQRTDTLSTFLEQVCVQDCAWARGENVQPSEVAENVEFMTTGDIRGYVRDPEMDAEVIDVVTQAEEIKVVPVEKAVSVLTRTTHNSIPVRCEIIDREMGDAIFDRVCALRESTVIEDAPVYFEPSLFDEPPPEKKKKKAKSHGRRNRAALAPFEGVTFPKTLDTVTSRMGIHLPRSTPPKHMIRGKTTRIYQCVDSRSRLTDILVDGRSLRGSCEAGRKIHGLITAGVSATQRELEWLVYIHFLEKGDVTSASGGYYLSLISQLGVEIRRYRPSLRMQALSVSLRSRPDLLFDT